MDFTESCNALAPAKHSTAFLKIVSQIKLCHQCRFSENYLESLVSTVFQSILTPRELNYITDQITDAGLCKNSKYFSSKHTKFQSFRVLGFKQIFSSKIFLFPELPDAGPFGEGAGLPGFSWASHTPQCGHPRVHPGPGGHSLSTGHEAHQSAGERGTCCCNHSDHVVSVCCS